MTAELCDPVQETVSMVQALSEHCAVFEVPDLASVSVTSGQILAQLWNEDPAALAADLLAWADTLTEIRCVVWYAASGDAPHRDLFGELSDGTPINVYGRLACSVAAVFGSEVKPGDRIALGLDHLVALTRLGVAA